LRGSIRWNVVVIGGGIAGCAMAIALRRGGVDRVCLLHSPVATQVAVGETLPPDVRRPLGELGVWECFLEQGHEPCLGSRSAWGGSELGYNDFVLNPFGFGWHLDRPRFEAMLLDEARRVDAAIFSIVRLAFAENAPNPGFVLSATEPNGIERSFAARYVVDATGCRSAFAQQIGARKLLLDRLSFVYGFFDASKGATTSRLTLIEAQELGWWYSARLPDNKLAVAFASDPSIVRDGRLAHEREWLDLLRKTRHVAQTVEGYRLTDMVARVAPTFRLDRVAGAHWLAVGDAAAACDPISSQGIMNALEDGVRASTVVTRALHGVLDGNKSYMEYISARYTDYLENRNYFYGLERRWRLSPFWRRRLARHVQAPLSNEAATSATSRFLN
jgi:flavin-dependent dehydrogenase